MITPAVYDAGVGAWLDGPEQVFDLLAGLLVDAHPWRGLVLDVGCGTGTAGRRLPARVLSVDSSLQMLGLARRHSAAVGGDALSLPLLDAVADGAVLGFVLNHLTDPVAGLREVARVLRPGAPVAATTWSADDPRHVQQAVEAVLRRHGWTPPAWYSDFKASAASRSDTPSQLAAAAATAGLREVGVAAVDVPLVLPPEALVAWRLGLPHTAPWLATVDRAAVEQEALASVTALEAPATRVLLLSARR